MQVRHLLGEDLHVVSGWQSAEAGARELRVNGFDVAGVDATGDGIADHYVMVDGLGPQARRVKDVARP